ncbi:DUF393 domain-containing protein [Mucilaginibacter sp. JRF]|uniref:DUF393 domain-containing protein n=1 Tax=Mucilaginibacter sp. JRF TaxID=2780088 RepID=UPI001882683F|nr:DUF393 domain-containing protein [Mucilaginibacter sp. JRF]MBE9586037.1 DUF393 domain-containing protein [Mucilaginibacter sp. JRF]
MKTLHNHIILYDAECPMCNLYTRAFVNTGMLDGTGRTAYQEAPEMLCPLIDRKRAVNEIALVNTQTGEVEYGIASLFKVIGNSFPVFKGLFNFKPFVWIAAKCYAFISYNRRVIVPGNQYNYGIQPTFKLRWRLTYLLFTWMVVGAILTQYAGLLVPMITAGNSWREYLICGGQILFQGLIVSLYAADKRWDYLGNMMTISFAGALLLLPVVILAQFIIIPALIGTLYFMLIAGLMFLEHIHRTKLLKLGWLLTATWMLYRLAVLMIII